MPAETRHGIRYNRIEVPLSRVRYGSTPTVVHLQQLEESKAIAAENIVGTRTTPELSRKRDSKI